MGIHAKEKFTEPRLPILRVALFTPIRRLFDYLPPKAISGESCQDLNHLKPGIRLKVPFGNSQRIAILVELANHSEYNPAKLKNVLEILDEEPLFSPVLLKLFHWAHQYYHCGLGEVMEAAVPSWLRKGKLQSDLNKPPKKQSKQSKKNSKESEDAQSLQEDSLQTHPVQKEIKKTEAMPVLSLNPEQLEAVKQISASLQQYKPFVLEGVTGSGKTEVYMQAIEHCLAKKLQVLVLVPEIGLTPQMLSRFESRFSVPIAVLHSSISEKKRAEAWFMAKEGLAPIVIGTRSSAFTPLKTPGLFIIDEEHDASFKQQDGFRYSARDLLIMRAHLEQCPIVLGSATPSLETIQNVRLGRYSRIGLSARAGNAQLPQIHILDIRHKKIDEGLSAQFIAMMKTHLEQKGQVLLFLNRRGFAPSFMCFDCGFIAECKRCDAKLTLHFASQKLRCHHCEFTRKVYERCPSCQHRNLHPLGVGTERVEAALKRYFPDKTIIRIDRDSTSRKGKMQEALARIHNQEAEILLGTQMLAKGHHFPNVTLVGILDIDQALFSNDFRSTERLGQLITQVAGRAGRAERAGQVLLQSCHPEHPLLKILIEKGYSQFAEHLLLERRATALPPFSYQALIRSETKKNTESLQFLKRLKHKVEEHMNHHAMSLQILGPVVAPMEKKDGKYRAQLLLQSEKRSTLQALMKELLDFVEITPPARSLRWSFDIDPIDMF